MYALPDLRDENPLSNPFATKLTAAWAKSVLAMSGAKVTVDGRQNLPDQPAIFCMNHTHKYDFLPIRSALFPTHRLITWVKARDYNDPWFRRAFRAAGNIPIMSRGYVISADVISTLGTKPDETTYRALRNHINDGEPLPDTELFDRICTTKRKILGRPFNPGEGSYRDAIHATYHESMSHTLELARRVISHGCHQQIYPQGTVASRLTEGKNGAIQAAIALDLPIVPVGVSGCIEAFGDSSLPLCRGDVSIRIGEPMEVIAPKGATPFSFEWEKKYPQLLKVQTQNLMRRIEKLVDETYRYVPGQDDSKQGVARFV